MEKNIIIFQTLYMMNLIIGFYILQSNVHYSIALDE